MDLLSQEQVTQLHHASLRILEETGILVKDQRAQKIFEQTGATVDHNRQLVRIPPAVVEKAIETAPFNVTLYGKEKSRLEFGTEKVHFINGFGTVNVLDWATQKTRKTTKQDLIDLVRVVDQMDQAAVVWPEIYPQDVPEAVIELHIAQVMLENTEKHCMLTCYNPDRIKDLIEIGRLLADGSLQKLREKPIVSIGLCATSPLVLDEIVAPCLVESAEAGLPIVLGSLAQGGATAPASLSGTLVVQNAELLGGLTLSQLVRPGNAFIWNDYSSILDQQYGEFVSSGPEMALLVAATAQLCRYYRIPQIGTAGATDANVLDVQAGYEKALTVLFAALSGAQAIHGAVSGWVEGLMTTCLAQIIVSNEMCSYVSRLLDGIDITPETLAVHVIHEVGPGGNFLTHDHTCEYFKKEQWFPILGQRIPKSQWLESGSKGVLDLAADRVASILAEEPRSFAPKDTRSSIQDVLNRAERGL
jgi:trimethylamine--corrinoid protein Co-methyltransferase